LLWISIAFLAGLLLGRAMPWAGPGWLGLAAAALLPILPLRRLRAGALGGWGGLWLGLTEPRLRLPPLLLLAALLLGAARISFHRPDVERGHIAGWNDQGAVRIRGLVSSPPDRRDASTLIRLEAAQATPLTKNGAPAGPPQPAHGLVLVVLPGGAAGQYGDVMELQGRLETPPENEEFSYREYLARQGVYAYLAFPRARVLERGGGNPVLRGVYAVRDWAYGQVMHLYPAPEAPLLAGILLGIENDLPEALSRAFQDTGTAHVIAISGFNIAILAGLFSGLFGRIFSRWWALVISILAIGFYTVLVGAAPSVVRAAIMGGMGLLAHSIGRRSAGLHALLLAAALMCLQNPMLPWDVSFQLSFGATLGLILYGERLQQGFQALLERRFTAQTARRIGGPVSEYVLMTLAAQWMTLPVILFHFHRLSVSSLLANPLILPVQPLVMILSGLAVLASAVWQPLGQLIAWLAWPLSAYTIRMVELLARIPGGVIDLGPMGPGALAIMVTTVLLPAIKNRLPQMGRAWAGPGIALAAAGLAAAFLLRAATFAPDGRLHLWLVDVQGSPVVLVRGPGGQTLLINGSESARALQDAIGRRVSPFEHRLDAVLITEPGAGALGALPGTLGRYPPGLVAWACDRPTSRAASRLESALRAQNIPVHTLKTGQSLSAGPVHVRAIGGPAQPDGAGMALRLDWQNFRVLLPAGSPPGSLPPEALRGLSAVILEPRDLEQTDPSTWLALAPQVVLAVEEGAPPADGANTRGANWLQTRAGGWLKITTDGQQMWLERQ
jgi:competence protein ComEC